MVLLKSILAGVVAVIAVVVLSAGVFIAWGWWMANGVAQVGSVGAVAYDVNTPWIMIPRRGGVLRRILLGIPKG
jgi:hypothetical protein